MLYLHKEEKKGNFVAMKKIIALILAAALIFSFAACSRQPANSGENSQSENSSEESVPEQPTSIRGVFEDGVYRNACGDFSIFFSESWEFDSDEELAADSGVTAELLAEGDAEKLFAKTDSVSELYAYREFDGSVVQIYVNQNLVPAADYLKMFLSEITASWTDSGFDIKSGEVRKFSVNGETVPGVSVEAAIAVDGDTVDAHYTALLREAGDYVYIICAYTFNSVPAERVLSNIYFSAEAKQQVDLRRGVVANGVYTNDSMGITIAPGDGWTFLSDDEMATLYGISSDLFTEDAAAKLENSSIVYDMYCHNDEGSSISVNFENINLFAGLILDEKSYLEFSSGNISEQFDETSGIRIVKNEMGEIEIDGKTVPCLYVTLRYEEQGIDIYEALAAQKRGSFFGVVTVSTLSENSLAETAKKITLE